MTYDYHVLRRIRPVLCTVDECQRLASRDASDISTRKREYVRDNTLAYFVLVNTWGYQALQYSVEFQRYLMASIQRDGLLRTISACATAADALISDSISSLSHEEYRWVSLLHYNEDPAEVLQLLRYPKRFSPEHADLLKKASTDTFLSLNSTLKQAQQTELPYWLVMRIRSRICHMLENYEYRMSDQRFSSGTYAGSKRSLADKVSSLGDWFPCLYDHWAYPIGQGSHQSYWYGTPISRDEVNVVAVNKSFKSSRLIGMEHAHNQTRAFAVSEAMHRSTSLNGYLKYCDFTNQSHSRLLCRIGSTDGSYATIDLSSASDSIREDLFRSVFPQNVIQDCDAARSAYLRIGKQKRTRQMFATSGSGMTYEVESLLFCAICLEAYSYLSAFGERDLLPPFNIGDDIIVDDRAAETTMNLLSLLGFSVNKDKSFWGRQALGYYRESCGAEYLNGIDLSTRYFPRTTVLADPVGISALCSLEHRLYDNVNARVFLIDSILALEPRMTAHIPGSECSDLWDVIDTGIPCRPAVYKRSECPDFEYRKYLALKSVRPSQQDVNIYPWSKNDLDMYYYTQYLLKGPSFDSPLDCLLNVSSPRKDYLSDVITSTQIWDWNIEF